jgi:lipopolysaccharide/colanic/teichoic acid biosynthesis glycosyltransferase
MSLVGPRPLPDRDIKGFNLDWQRRRFCVKPVITCPAIIQDLFRERLHLRIFCRDHYRYIGISRFPTEPDTRVLAITDFMP